MTPDPDSVCDDVSEGWVSVERARDTYGVVFRETESDHPYVETVATEAIRHGARS
jgi:hypothetical protein